MLRKRNFTARKMFEMSDEFYGSLGLEPNKMSYTGYSIISKPGDRIIQCHASAWDFHDGEDYRIKMCTNINQKDLITIHHEMGEFQSIVYAFVINASANMSHVTLLNDAYRSDYVDVDFAICALCVRRKYLL